MTNEEKKQQVEKISQELSASEAVVLADYSGLTVADVNELRTKLAELGAGFQVVKNTMLRIAFEETGLKNGDLSGPTAVLTSGQADPIESIRELVTALKEKGKGEVKFGFFEKVFMEAARVLELSSLPGKQALQAQLVYQLASPLTRFARALSYSQRSFVVVLDQIGKARGGVDNG
ncbi:MAG: 50S ribosomal protein L10 [bacterium]|nr:50S ribosomal protein L10 [bacterium]